MFNVRNRSVGPLGTLAVLATLALVPCAPAAAASPGALNQLTGTDGCLSTSGNPLGCAVGSAVKESTSAAVSPDGKNVYVAATDTPGVEVLSRDSSTGAVRQLAGTGGCITGDGTDDNGTAGACASANGLGASGPNYVTVSPDGKSVYVVNGGAATILVFARDASTGALSQVQCLGDGTPPTGCTSAAAGSMYGDLHGVIVSADGAHVYAVTGGGGPYGAVLVFNRDAGTGALTAPAAPGGCVTVDGTDGAGTAGGCGTARALEEPYGLALAPDGKQLYVAASEGDEPSTGDGAVVTLIVQSNGTLVQPSGPAGCLSASGTGNTGDPTACAKGKPAHDLNGVAVSPDGKSVYAASAGNGGTSTPGAVEILSRDPATGNLSQDVSTTAGCLSVDGTDGDHATAGTCATARGIAETYRITVSPDGGTVYVASQGVTSTPGANPGAIAVFGRSASGALAQLSGTDGCISDGAGDDGQGGTTCAPGRALSGAYQLVLSPDCTSAYVASQEAPGLAAFAGRPCLAPLAHTDPATGVTATGATLNGTVNPRGTSTSVVFEYGTSTAYGTTTAGQDAGAGSADGKFSVALMGLTPSTTYHYRVVATNAYGKAAGADQVFSTAAPAGSSPPPPPPARVSPAARCVVPKLRHKTLSQARKLLAAHHCRLGRVKVSAAAKRRGKLVVLRSDPPAGGVLPNGGLVVVRLVSSRPAIRHRPPTARRPRPEFTG